MFTNPGFTLADQFSGIVELFRKTMWAEPRTRGLGALSVAIWQRVRGFERRFAKLYAMWKAGTLPVRRVSNREGTSPRPSPDSGEGANGGDRAAAPPPPRLVRSAAQSPVKGEGDVQRAEAAIRRPASVLPRGLRWLHQVLPWSAGTLASRVGPLLWDCPEMRAFAADCPQVGRVLRPMCRMAGLTPPEWLALPKRAVAPPPLQPSPVTGEGAKGTGRARRRTPREVAADAMARSERTGKPIDPRKIGAVAYGYVLHWPRDDNCPPPEIGYGGRWRKPPKDYEPPPRDWE